MIDFLVPGAGIEPARPFCGRGILSKFRLFFKQFKTNQFAQKQRVSVLRKLRLFHYFDVGCKKIGHQQKEIFAMPNTRRAPLAGNPIVVNSEYSFYTAPPERIGDDAEIRLPSRDFRIPNQLRKVRLLKADSGSYWLHDLKNNEAWSYEFNATSQ